LEEIKPSSRSIDSTSSTTGSDDEQQQKQQSLKNKFAKIKAKFEQNNSSNVMGSRSTTSSSNNTTSTRQNSRKQMDDLYARHRRASNESIPNNNNNKNSSNQSVGTQNSYYRSQSIGSEKSKTNSFRRFNSADEADEEVSRIHRQGEELRRYSQQTPSMSSSIHDIPQQSNSQYEIIDEDGNPVAINGVQDLIKMSGVCAREVPQPDGTIVKEYVIDDPQLLSQFRSQQQQQQQSSPMTTSYIQQRNIDQDAPPPPPRIPLRPPILFRQGGSTMSDSLPYNIQQIHVLESQRRYEYLTTTGRRIQFIIINSDSFNGKLLSDLDIRELTNAINLRLLPSSNPIAPPPPPQQQQQQQGSFAQASFNRPKQWHPSVDLTHRQRLGSDTQAYSNNSNTGFQPMQTDISRSASSGALNQGTYFSPNQQQQQVFHEPNNQWNTSRYQDSHNQRYQPPNEPFQSSAQFLPQQQITNSMHSPPIYTNHSSAFHQQSTTYPYQGQQQHGVRICNDFNQQRTAIVNDGNTRI
jgi:hypothetical protein